MKFAEQALALQGKGNNKQAIVLFKQALDLEMRAQERVNNITEKDPEPTISILTNTEQTLFILTENINNLTKQIAMLEK